MISCISLFDIISVVLLLWPDPNTFLCIPASAADSAAVNPKEIKTLFVYGLITFFINGNPVFSNRPSNLPRNPHVISNRPSNLPRNPRYSIILDNLVFDNLISGDK